MKKFVCIFVLIVTTSSLGILTAQPSYIYQGGDGGGYHSGEDLIPILYQFLGGNGVGYTAKDNLIINPFIYSGGLSDGYSGEKNTLINPPFFLGGEKSGFAMNSANDTQTISLFGGGVNDGYVLSEKCEDFIWTGAVGTGWLVPENWNYTMVPDLKRRVIIPAGVPSFPYINAGIFAIGENPNGGIYECADLWVQNNALLVARVGNFVENYSDILIDGTMEVKNPSPNAMQNLGIGVIRISPTGILLIKP